MIELGLTMVAFWATTVHSSCLHDLHCGPPTTMIKAPNHLGSNHRWDCLHFLTHIGMPEMPLSCFFMFAFWLALVADQE
ncbi:hypothetical protein MKW94_010291 [Papaver nudicaule]|uniref:Secreted protein n=1 Tax=Papaver nudicaule TaxID=74823 RepID=A0AA41VNJ2_PAPNU|nr:hypothetical protein [Papaver nudicaule]